jgi:hypothetical protein
MSTPKTSTPKVPLDAQAIEKARAEIPKLIKDLTSEEKTRLKLLAQEFIREVTEPIQAGDWCVDDVITKHLHYYLIMPTSFPVAILKHATKAKIKLHGSRVEVTLSDIEGKRVGWLPHHLEPKPIPAILLTASPWMNHKGLLALEVTQKFSNEDLMKITEAVDAYQTRIIGALTADLARDAKAWKEIANQRAISAYDQALNIVQILLITEYLWKEEWGGINVRKFQVRARKWYREHKRSVNCVVFLIIVALCLFAFIFVFRIPTPITPVP